MSNIADAGGSPRGDRGITVVVAGPREGDRAGHGHDGKPSPAMTDPTRTREFGEKNWRSGNLRALFAFGAVVAALIAILVSLSPGAGAAEAGPAPESTAAADAVRALTGDRPALAVIPADFAATQGYRPMQLAGMPVDPSGECSSPIPLPAEFDTACKAHDLGYDLLRYAEVRGHPLGPWARRAIDNALETRMFAACDSRGDLLARTRCTTMATIATAAVDLNSRRQNYAAPMPEYLFGRQLSGTELGPQVVHVLARLAMVLLMVAALFAIVRRTIPPRRAGQRTASPATRWSPWSDSRGASAGRMWSRRSGGSTGNRDGRVLPARIGAAASRTARGAREWLSRNAVQLRGVTVRGVDGIGLWPGTPATVAAGGGAWAPGQARPAVTALELSPLRRPGAGGTTGTTPSSHSFERARNALGAVIRRLVTIGKPRTGTLVASAAGISASLAPGLLPRTSVAQALLTALLVLIALGVAGLGRKVLGHWVIDTEAGTRRFRKSIVIACCAVAGTALTHAWYWQNRLRAAMDFPPVGVRYWLHWAIGVVAVVVPIVLILRGLRWAARYVGRLRAAALVTATVLACQFALLPAVVNWQRSAFASADAAIDPTVVRPVSYTRSGSPESAVSWSSLGAEGRKFVAERGRSVRVYIGMDSAPDLDSRVALAIREIERSGGFDRRHLVVMVPTGSGWLDAGAARGLDERFDGDATLVGMQYSQAPSWATFLFARADAERSARALFTGIERHLAGLAHPPKLYVYGQSLGATAGSAIFADDRDESARVCAALWAGPPASAVHRGGATVLANSSDPVVQWSPRLLWRAPDLTGTRHDAPHPMWLPGLSWVQTTADLLSALAPGPGHGHRYGSDQGTALGSC
ncbi:alpha/beta-hydrolase family protein [Nocardia aobensis]|uniref:alpha/beta-hydrolase family protein n=1 Tax=Nocardia aobensis TaxID=257277 RepID=UPI001FE02229|nr:alpha/beta-hydrolase family protein [Nocardia aobensis]